MILYSSRDVPLTPQQLLDALRSEGLTVVEWPGWRDACRCHYGSHERGEKPRPDRPFVDVVGTIVHHTAGDTTNPRLYVQNVLVAAGAVSPDFPLKCNFAVDASGTVWLLSAGHTNHDLMMSDAAYTALRDGTFSLDGYQNLRGNDRRGSSHTYGIENIARAAPNAAQVEASVRICAAISRAHGWSGRDAAGHGEVATDRVYEDPGLNMGTFRRAVMARVAGHPIQEDEDMTPEEHGMLANAHAQATIAARYAQGIVERWDAAAVNGLLTEIKAAIRANGPALTDDQLRQAINDALASQVKVTGTLEVTPRDVA